MIDKSKYILVYNTCIKHISSTESQKGVNVVQQCSVENQKGDIATDIVQR